MTFAQIMTNLENMVGIFCARGILLNNINETILMHVEQCVRSSTAIIVRIILEKRKYGVDEELNDYFSRSLLKAM